MQPVWKISLCNIYIKQSLGFSARVESPISSLDVAKEDKLKWKNPPEKEARSLKGHRELQPEPY